MAEVQRKLISNTIYLLAAWIGSIIFNFVFQLFAAKNLLPGELGTLSTAINFSAIVASILTFGMDQTTQRLTAYYLGTNKTDYLRSILWFFLLLMIFLNIISIGGLLLFSSKISQLIKLPQNVFLLSVFVLFPLSLSVFLAGVIRGYQNMRYLTITAMLGDFLKMSIAVSLVLIGYRFFGFLIAYIVAAVVVFMLRIGSIKLFITKFKIPNIRLVVRYALPSFITQFFWLILLNGQYLIISAIQNTYATGIFAVGMLLSNQIYFIPRIISDALFPITSKLSGNKNLIQQQRNLLNLALRYSLLVSVPILVFVTLFPKSLIFLIGRPHFFPAVQLIPVLVTASLFFGIATLLSRTLYAIGKPITFQNISIVCAIFYLITAFTLTYLYSAFGTSVAFLLTALLLAILSLYYLRKYISFKIDFTTIYKILISSFLAFISLYAVSSFVPNLIIGGILTAIFTLLYFIILYFLKFYNENDVKILNFVSEKVPFSSIILKIIKWLLLKKIQSKTKNYKQSLKQN